MTEQEIRKKIKKIIDDNIEEIPYEGADVDYAEIEEDLMDLFRELKDKLYENNKK